MLNVTYRWEIYLSESHSFLKAMDKKKAPGL